MQVLLALTSLFFFFFLFFVKRWTNCSTWFHHQESKNWCRMTKIWKGKHKIAYTHRTVERKTNRLMWMRAQVNPTEKKNYFAFCLGCFRILQILRNFLYRFKSDLLRAHSDSWTNIQWWYVVEQKNSLKKISKFTKIFTIFSKKFWNFILLSLWTNNFSSNYRWFLSKHSIKFHALTQKCLYVIQAQRTKTNWLYGTENEFRRMFRYCTIYSVFILTCNSERNRELRIRIV